jgi:hypothetical protein
MSYLREGPKAQYFWDKPSIKKKGIHFTNSGSGSNHHTTNEKRYRRNKISKFKHFTKDITIRTTYFNITNITFYHKESLHDSYDWPDFVMEAPLISCEVATEF